MPTIPTTTAKAETFVPMFVFDPRFEPFRRLIATAHGVQALKNAREISLRNDGSAIRYIDIRVGRRCYVEDVLQFTPADLQLGLLRATVRKLDAEAAGQHEAAKLQTLSQARRLEILANRLEALTAVRA